MVKEATWRHLVTAIVWLIWLGMTIDLSARFWRASFPVPLAEDWLMVAPLTANEPDLGSWLWRQNNEHRLPLARLLYLGVLKAAHGDFRAQGALNLALMAGLAAGLLLFMRKLRNGQTRLADIFFPVLLLHWGNSVQYLFPFLVQLVVPVIGVIVLGCIIVRAQTELSPRMAGLAGTIVLLMPLFGLHGMLLVVAPVAFLSFVAWASWNGQAGWPQDRRISWTLALFIILTVVEAGLYFVGYEQPGTPPPVGLRLRVHTAVTVLSYQFGPAAMNATRIFNIVSSFAWLATGTCLLAGLMRSRAGGVARTAGFAVFVASTVAFPLAIGWARAPWVRDFGIPTRYVIFSAPALIFCFVTWELWGGPRLRAWVPRVLAIAMSALVPFNAKAGDRYFNDWYQEGMGALQRDIDARASLSKIAQRNQKFLFHSWSPAELEKNLRWLHDAGMKPFAAVADEPQAIGRKP
jgi:hypothetical protein